MRIPYPQHWVLRRIEGSLRRSDPHMVAMLAIFARLTAGEVITSSGPPIVATMIGDGYHGRILHIWIMFTCGVPTPQPDLRPF